MATRKQRAWAWWVTLGVALLVGLTALNAWVRRQNSRPSAILAGRTAYDRGDWSGAARFARERLKLEAKDPEALRLLARSSIRMGRDAAGMQVYSHGLSRHELEPEDEFLLGLAAVRQGDEETALAAWSRGAGQSPEHPELLLSFANLLGRVQRLDESAALARRLSKIPGWEAAGFLMLGTNCCTVEDFPAAAEALSRGLESDPDAQKALLEPAVYRKMLARCLLSLGRAADADRWLKPLLLQGENSQVDTEAAWLASRSALQQKDFDRFRTELARASSYRASNPLVPEPAVYVGSARCSICHLEVSKSHAETHHSRTFYQGAALLSLPLPPTALADPVNAHVTHNFVRDGAKIKVQSNIDSRIHEVIVEYAFGTQDRYVTMVGRDADGTHRALRLSYFRGPSGSGWSRTAGDVGTAVDKQSLRGQVVAVRDGVVRCLQCHVTSPREFRDPEKIGAGPEAADSGIGCERCHGPGGNHLLAVEANLADRAILNVGLNAGDVASQFCVECHTVGDTAEIRKRPQDPAWVRSTGITMTFSRCYQELPGELSCMTCHDPHRDAEQSAAFYERKCLACHQTTAPSLGKPAQPAVRSTPCKVNPTCDCLNCHMPKIPMPDLHTTLTDHYIRVHNEGRTK